MKAQLRWCATARFVIVMIAGAVVAAAAHQFKNRFGKVHLEVIDDELLG